MKRFVRAFWINICQEGIMKSGSSCGGRGGLDVFLQLCFSVFLFILGQSEQPVSASSILCKQQLL